MKKFIFLYRDIIRLNGDGVLYGVAQNEFIADPLKLLDTFIEELNEEHPECGYYGVSPYFEGQQTGGYMIAVSYSDDIPDALLEEITDWIRDNTNVMTVDDFADRLKKEVAESFAKVWNREGIQAAINKLPVPEDPEDRTAVLDWLVGDQHGVYMLELLLRNYGVKCPKGIIAMDIWLDLTDEILAIITESVKVPGCYVEFTEGGIALMVQLDTDTESEPEVFTERCYGCGFTGSLEKVRF